MSEHKTTDDFRVFFAVWACTGGALTWTDWCGLTPKERGAAVSAAVGDVEEDDAGDEEQAMQKGVQSVMEDVPGIVVDAG